MSEYIWKIKHTPTGLFYCSRKGRWIDNLTNLSTKGNFYESEARAVKVFKSDCPRAYINKAQVDKHNLYVIDNGRWSYSIAEIQDFKIIKYELIESTINC